MSPVYQEPLVTLSKSLRDESVLVLPKVSPTPCHPIRSVKPICIGAEEGFEFLLLPTKENSGICVKQIVDANHIEIPHDVQSIDSSCVVGKIGDRSRDRSLFSQKGQSLIAELFSRFKAHHGMKQTAVRCLKHNGSIPIKVAPDEVSKKMIGDLVRSGKAKGPRFARSTSKSIQVREHLTTHDVELTHRKYSPSFRSIYSRSIGPIDQMRKSFQQRVIKNGKSDCQHLSTSYASICVQKPQPVGFFLRVNDREKTIVLGESRIHFASGSKSDATSNQKGFDLTGRNLVGFSERVSALQFGRVLSNDFIFSGVVHEFDGSDS